MNEVKKNKKNAGIIKNLINKSSRPVLLVGAGVRSSNAITELKKLSEDNNIPVTFTSSGADIYGSKNKLSIGSVDPKDVVGLVTSQYKTLIYLSSLALE